MTYLIVLIVTLLLIWTMITQSNPKNIRGIVYYKTGVVYYTRVFERFSDYEEYHDAMIENYGNEILKITWEYADTNKNTTEE